MDLNGKKILFLGDSITACGGTSAPENVYWRVLGQITGAECVGYGISGTRIARQHKPSEIGSYDRHFVSRVEEMDEQADAVIVFGGTNDYGHGDAPFGHMNDRTDETFYGALHVLYQKLITRYPTAHIVVLTPPHRGGESGRLFNDCGIRQDHDLEDYVNAIREVAGCYGLPVLDLFHNGGMQPNIPEQKEAFMPDALHPNDAGHRRIATLLIGLLESL